jgi:DNA replication and repair protein RecF
MRIKTVRLKNFRNYGEQTVEFSNGLNVLSGKNASGKTNLLEAVYLAGVGRSPRTSKEKELIKYNEDCASVKITVEKKYRSHSVELYFDKSGKKSVKIDGIPVQKMGELLGVLNVVFFSPDELKFIKDTPDVRRRFMDISLSQQKKDYFYALQRYTKALKQRNNLLKQNSPAALEDLLDVWDVQLANEGAKIVLERNRFIEELAAPAKAAHLAVSGVNELLELSYETDVEGVSYEEIRVCLIKKLSAAREKDIRLQFTSVGPHRDDIAIFLNGADARRFSSQGQQRTAALSVKLSELKLFLRETGETPVLLLDDVLSELDETRQNLLIKEASFAQVILTCTSFPVNSPRNLFIVENGTVLKM